MSQQATKEIDGLGGERLGESLLGGADVGGEAFEGGIGALEPAEDASLGEGRPGPEAFASDEAGLGGNLVGVGGEQAALRNRKFVAPCQRLEIKRIKRIHETPNQGPILFRRTSGLWDLIAMPILRMTP